MNTADSLQAMLRSLGLPALASHEADQLSLYLNLLLRWNGKINLSAIRGEEAILRRHFAESIQCARSIPADVGTLLDYGSGGGFPGMPCAILRPEIAVTLAESQGKKASFLREVVRTLGLKTTVHGGRVEDLPHALSFDAVTLRAVDNMKEACQQAATRLSGGGWMMILTTVEAFLGLRYEVRGIEWHATSKLAGSEHEVLVAGKRFLES